MDNSQKGAASTPQDFYWDFFEFYDALNLTSTPKKKQSSMELHTAIRQRDAFILEKDNQIRRLTAAVSAFGEDAHILDKLIAKAQQMSNQLLERDHMCQALKNRVISLDAKIHDLVASGHQQKPYTPSHFIEEVMSLRQQVRQQSQQLELKEERITELSDEVEARDQKLQLFDGFVQRSFKYRRLLEERDAMCQTLLLRVADLEATSSSMVSQRDYEAVCQRKRNAEEENAELRLKLKKLKTENKALAEQCGLL